MCPAPPAPPASPDAHYVRLEAPPTPTSEATEATTSGTSAAATAAVLANAVMGAGILALPLRLREERRRRRPGARGFAGPAERVHDAFTVECWKAGRPGQGFRHAVASGITSQLWWLADAFVCSMMALVATSSYDRLREP